MKRVLVFCMLKIAEIVGAAVAIVGIWKVPLWLTGHVERLADPGFSLTFPNPVTSWIFGIWICLAIAMAIFTISVIGGGLVELIKWNWRKAGKICKCKGGRK